MKRAIALAEEAEREGNVPVGALIVLDGEVVGSGKSMLLEPYYHPGRHAEVEALSSVDPELWPRSREMTCYSTLEPCVMCAGTLLLHGVGRVVFGARDVLGGAGCVLDHLPPYYDEGGVYDWVGPLSPSLCDPLYKRADAIFADLPVGRTSWAKPALDTSARACLDRLSAWRDDPDSGIRQARKDIGAYAASVGRDAEQVELVLPFARVAFETTTYLKDYKILARLARRAGNYEPLEEVAEIVREHLPDVWIKNALDRGDLDAAIECWYEKEDHKRLRHAADRMVRTCGDDRPELVMSCRLSTINYLIGRKKRRHYRRACAELRKLRDELEDRDAAEYWPLVLDDIRSQYGHLKALADELDKAGF